jgi:hypothetical protein
MIGVLRSLHAVQCLACQLLMRKHIHVIDQPHPAASSTLLPAAISVHFIQRKVKALQLADQVLLHTAAGWLHRPVPAETQAHMQYISTLPAVRTQLRALQPASACTADSGGNNMQACKLSRIQSARRLDTAQKLAALFMLT